MRQAISIMCCLVIFFSCSCSGESELEADEYIKYIENKSNGFKKEVIVNNLVYTFLYKPIEYVAYKELQGSDDTIVYRKRLTELSKTIWFNIYVKPKEGNINPLKNNVGGLADYNSRLNYFLIQAGKNLKLYYGNSGSMSNVAYHFENNYGLTPMDVMVVGFEIPHNKPIEDLLLEYDDQLFNGGIIKIKINKEQLSEIPQIIL